MKLIFSSQCLLIGLLVLVGGETISAQTKETAFIGWIPVQNFTGGKKVELDLTRFVTLPAGAKLEVERPLPLDQVKLQLESSECILRILPEPGAQGMEDFVLRIRPRQGDPLEGGFFLLHPVHSGNEISLPRCGFRKIRLRGGLI